VRGILSAERTALNFLARLRGIATLTAKYVDAIAGLTCSILDTRKTAPGLRYLDKYAVKVGGGRNHRFHLGDGVLVKDNHWVALRLSKRSLKDGIAQVRAQAHHLVKVEVEVKNQAEAQEAMDAGADVLMLDNMGLEETRHVVALARGRVLVEASGGITLDTVRAVAETGVDFISVGALTHSATALDVSLELEYQA
ncbi:MAG: carboxylating nicotinate-nucleotide diphosphorylase, partial [Chloroflexota bacterium]